MAAPLLIICKIRMKTRQQRLAEERAGRPPSPQLKLEDNLRRRRRNRAKTPSAVVAAGPVVPAEKLARPEEPQALLRVWVDPASTDDNPTYQVSMLSARVPELLLLIERIRDQGKESSFTTAPTSAQVTPSLDRRQFAPGPSQSHIEPELQETSPQIAPQTTPAHVVPPFQKTSQPIATPTPYTHTEQFLQEIPRPVTPYKQLNFTESPFQEISRPMAPGNSFTTSSASTQITPSLGRRQFAPGPSPSCIDPELQETSPQMAPQTARARVVPPFQEASRPLAPPAPSARVEKLLRETSRPVTPYKQLAFTELSFQESSRPMAPQNSFTTSPASTEVTSLDRRQFAPSPSLSRIEPELQGTSQKMAPQTAPARVVPPFQETSRRMAPPAPSARVKRILQETSRPEIPYKQPAFIESPLQKSSRPMIPHTKPARARSPVQEISQLKTSRPSPPASAEEAFQPTSHAVQLPYFEKLISTTPQSVRLACSAEQSVVSSHSNLIGRQTLDKAMPDSEIGELVQSNRTEPSRNTMSPSQGQTAADRLIQRKKKALSCKPMVPLPIARKLEPMPFFCNHEDLPAYTADGRALYGPVVASKDHQKFQQLDEGPASEGSEMDDVDTPETPQDSRLGLGRLIRPTHSVKSRFGFSPLTPVSESSEPAPQAQEKTTAPTQTSSTKAILWPSRNLNRRINKRKRWTSPDIIPNPKGKSHELGEVEFYGNSGKDGEDGAPENQPSKVRRTCQTQNFSSQVTGSLDASRPYTSQQSIAKTPTKITNSAGTFKVPSPGDSDWSESESEDEVVQEASQRSTVKNPGSSSRRQFTAYEEWLQTASPAVRAAVGRMEVNPNAAGHEFDTALNYPEPTGRPIFNAYEGWCETASPAVTAALEQMEVDSDIAGEAFAMGLGNYSTQ